MADQALMSMQRARPQTGTPPSSGEGEAEIRRLKGELDALRQELRVTRARLAEAEARAEIDPLVDALNRRGFERELARAIVYARRYGTPAALVYIDLDDFKPVNDRFGHAAGDALLRHVAATLTANVRASDVVARLGGDEFAVLLWNVTEADAVAKAGALQRAIAESRCAWQHAALAVGASVGTTMLRPDDVAAATIARADAAMYRAKAGGKSPEATQREAT